MAAKRNGGRGKGTAKRITAKRVQATEDLPPKVPTVAVKPETDDDPYESDGLTTRQRRFVDALVGPAGGNATKAAEMAGYRTDNRNALASTAWENLRKPEISKAIALAFAAKNLTPEWTQKRLTDIAGADMNNFLSVDAEGNVKTDFAKAAARGALGQIRDYDPERGKLRLYDPTPALTTLLKLFGLLTDKHEMFGVNGGPVQVDLSILTDDELASLKRIRQKLLPAGSEPNRN